MAVAEAILCGAASAGSLPLPGLASMLICATSEYVARTRPPTLSRCFVLDEDRAPKLLSVRRGSV